MNNIIPLIEYGIPENKVVKELTFAQKKIIFEVGLASILLFGAGTLTPKEEELQNTLTKEYLAGLSGGDKIELGLVGAMGGMGGEIISNEGGIIKIKSKFFNKKKIGIRSFSAITGYMKAPILKKGYDGFEKNWLYIDIPEPYIVESTRGIPSEAFDEIDKVFKQAGDPTTSYSLV